MGVEVRPVDRCDLPAVVAMVHELADYERAAGQCHLTVAQLDAALFAERPALFGHVAWLPGEPEPVGMMLWFLNFSTWRGVHGIYLEDLYVRPTARHGGVGRALLAALARICVERGYERLDWGVLDWNPARRFYDAVGSAALDEWVPYRLSGPALDALAASVPATTIEAVQSSRRDAG
jgi:GNAT superfamily N-acetyltransferase